MMNTPSEQDPRDQASNRKLLAAVLGLGGLVVAIGGVAVYTAMSSPRAADAAALRGSGAGRAGAAAAVGAGLDAAAKYQGEGKFAEAGAILAKLAETDPTDRAVRVAYAQALMGQKQFDAGYQQYEAALALMPAGTTEKIAKGEDAEAAKLHFEAGTCANMAGKLGRAEEHYSMAQTADRKEPRYPLYLAMVQLKKGGKDGESAATASLMRAVHLNPELGEAWGTLAEIALRNDQLNIAEQHLEKARRLQPDSVRWRMVEARVLNRRGQAEQAAALLTALRDEQRHEPAVLGVLAESYGLMRRPADAAAMYAKAFAAVTPPNAELAYQAALWFERASNGGEAAKFARSAAVLGHKDAAETAQRLSAAGN
jgi:predicted Zn-dependent protease